MGSPICDLHNTIVDLQDGIISRSISGSVPGSEVSQLLVEIQRQLNVFRGIVSEGKNPERFWRFLHDLQWGAIESVLLLLGEDKESDIYKWIQELDENLEGIRQWLEDPKVICSIRNENAMFLPSM